MGLLSQSQPLGDYCWVERTRDLRSPQRMLPYHGPAWYWIQEVHWMLDAGIIASQDITHTFTASAHLPPEYLSEKLRHLDETWSAAVEAAAEPVLSKHATCMLFGCWGITEHNRYC